MLHGVSVNLTAFSRYHGNPQGQVFTIFVLTIAACEAGLALALFLSLYQRSESRWTCSYGANSVGTICPSSQGLP